MKQASNSLLTIVATPFNRMPDAWGSREKASACGRRFTLFFVYQEKMQALRSFLLGLSCLLRRTVRFRLSEGRIRSLLCGMPLAAFLLSAAQMLVPNIEAGERLIISLREDAAIVTPSICLKDIADLRGPDTYQLEKLAQTTIGESPVFGETTILSRHQVSDLVQTAAGPLPAGTFVGASAVRIRWQGKQITADEINPIVSAYILGTTSWKESEIVIRSIGNLKGIELPPTEAAFRISTSEAVIGKRNILMPLEIMQGGKNLGSYWITAEIGVRAEVLMAAGKISSGKAVKPGDVEKKIVEVPDMRASYVREPEEVLGKVSLRSLLPGDLLTREVFTDPLLIKSGETVRLRLERDGFMLTSLAKAEQDGRLGQLIRVRSVDFSTFLKAQVTGRSEVRMQ
jgi:flagellar basal body P-ring formation protein FlgA